MSIVGVVVVAVVCVCASVDHVQSANAQLPKSLQYIPNLPFTYMSDI